MEDRKYRDGIWGRKGSLVLLNHQSSDQEKVDRKRENKVQSIAKNTSSKPLMEKMREAD